MTLAATLPSGLVTFVLTDIEGSTKMFRRLGDGYPPLLETHNSLLREQWAAHGGAEVKTVGDAFIVAFESAADAMAASVAAQRAVASHQWPSDGVMRIRVGVHAGMAFARDGDYVALALHQAARVVNAANGGQVIASDDAVAAAGDSPAVRFQPIGAFRLRDFERPVRLAAVRAADEEADQPVAVRAVPAEGHNLMTPTTSFVGRGDEVADLAARLGGGHIVTIVGAGGMGKTRLAVEVGLHVAPTWPDGVWLVDLSTVADGRLVAAAVSEAVGASPGDGDDERESAIAHLASRQALVILDNCEHVLGAAGELVGALVARCSRVGVLTTSRVPLALPSEELWRIEPLAIVDDAVNLFVGPGPLPGARLHAERRRRGDRGRDLPPSRRHAARHRAGGGPPLGAVAGRDPAGPPAAVPAPADQRPHGGAPPAQHAGAARLGPGIADAGRAGRVRPALGVSSGVRPRGRSGRRRLRRHRRRRRGRHRVVAGR